MNDSGSAPSRPSSFPSWLLPLLILVVVILGYGISPCRLPLWGEETCRARHGIEMAQSGDWLVATFQSVPGHLLENSFSFINGSAKRNHELDISEAHVFSDLFHGLTFQGKAFPVAGIVVAGGATESDHGVLFRRFEILPAN